MKRIIAALICLSCFLIIFAQNNSTYSEKRDYYEEGMKFYLEGQYSNAFESFKLGFDLGDVILCPQMLAELYYSGLGCDRDEEKSVGLFKIAADNSNPYAQYSLGIAYYNGIGCVKNDEIARKYYKLAADSGFIPEAAYNYGSMLFNGEGGLKDLNESLKYYIKASDSGFPDAQYCVALVYYYGEYKGMRLKQDKNKALELFKKSASNGLTKAAIAIDKLY